jgi:hypothetical protein
MTAPKVVLRIQGGRRAWLAALFFPLTLVLPAPGARGGGKWAAAREKAATLAESLSRKPGGERILSQAARYVSPGFRVRYSFLLEEKRRMEFENPALDAFLDARGLLATPADHIHRALENAAKNPLSGEAGG